MKNKIKLFLIGLPESSMIDPNATASYQTKMNQHNLIPLKCEDVDDPAEVASFKVKLLQKIDKLVASIKNPIVPRPSDDPKIILSQQREKEKR